MMMMLLDVESRTKCLSTESSRLTSLLSAGRLHVHTFSTCMASPEAGGQAGRQAGRQAGELAIVKRARS